MSFIPSSEVLSQKEISELATVFSTAVFERISQKKDCGSFRKKAKRNGIEVVNKSNLHLVQEIYQIMLRYYRCEYVYKNKLFNTIIHKYGLEDSVILDEFNIGRSKADMILLNGEVKIFEIKTELDDLSRLRKQIKDYQKFADKVSVVTHKKFVDAILNQWDDSTIGVLVLQNDGKIEVVRSAIKDHTHFEFETIFKLLRKSEYLDIVFEVTGTIPSEPNTRIFRACYDLLSKLDLGSFQKLVCQKLKQRKLKHPELVTSTHTPQELRYICNVLNFKKKDYKNLYRFLNN